MGSYAIVIGISHYKPPKQGGLKELKGAIPDAEAVAKWLKDSGQVDEENIRLITSETGLDKVIKNDIDTEIANILKEISEKKIEGERLYFYFAGHGFGIETDSKNNGLCMSNWDDYYMFNAATLSSLDYKTKFLTEGLFKEIVIWLDCCRNTKLFANPAPSSGARLRGDNRRTKYFLAMATTYDSQAFEAFNKDESDKEPRGIFTSVLLKGLQGAAKGSDEKITAESLIDYLDINVPIEAEKAGHLQEPEFDRNTTRQNNILFN